MRIQVYRSILIAPAMEKSPRNWDLSLRSIFMWRKGIYQCQLTLRVLGHAVRLCTKNRKKIKKIEDYKSYKVILSPENEIEFPQTSIFHYVLKIFYNLTGYKFLPAISNSKLHKVLPAFQSIVSVRVNRIDIDLAKTKLVYPGQGIDPLAL